MSASLTMTGAVRSPASSPEEEWDISPRLRRRILAEPSSPRPPIEPDRPIPTSRGILTAAEIEMLLRPDLSDMDAEAASLPQAHPLPGLTRHEAGKGVMTDAACRLAARLTRAFRDNCGLPAAFSVKTVSPVVTGTAIAAQEERGQAILCFSSGEDEIVAMLVLSAGLCQTMIETACGARGRRGAPGPLSPIDIALIEGLTRPIASCFGTGLRFASVETDPLYAASLFPSGRGHEISFAVMADGTEAFARAILAGPPDVSPPVRSEGNEQMAGRRNRLTALLTARVASVHLPLSRLTGLRPGTTLMLGVPADQKVELLSGDHSGEVAAEAEIGRKGHRIALRITRHGPALRAFAPPSPG